MLVVFVIVGWIGFTFVYETPTCFDSKRNGDEEGIDCGGSCEKICRFQAVDPIVLWNRFFEIAPNVYNAVALIENPNSRAQSGPIPYTLKLYDEAGILVYERKGETEIPPERKIPIFETNIVTGQRIPVRSTFTFDRSPDWQQATTARLKVTFSDTKVSNASTTPRLDAVVTNNNLVQVSDITIVAVLSDANSNAIAVSRTVVKFLSPGEQKNIVFTWPLPLTAPVVSVEIITKFPI